MRLIAFAGRSAEYQMCDQEAGAEVDAVIDPLAQALAIVPGITAIALGGSRARGTATSASDIDIGLYYHRGAEPDVGALRAILAGIVDDRDAAVITEVGGWGPWIVGGAWLAIEGRKVDLLYRCLENVEAVIHACRFGEVTMAYQPGHPHGFCSAIWMGEAALCRPLRDPEAALTALKALSSPYPEPLAAALIRRFQFEVGFSIENGALAVPRGDSTHVAGCAYRALACVGQTLFALNRRYLINEKRALEEAANFPVTVPRLAERAAAVWREIGCEAFRDALAELAAIDRDLKALISA